MITIYHYLQIADGYKSVASTFTEIKPVGNTKRFVQSERQKSQSLYRMPFRYTTGIWEV